MKKGLIKHKRKNAHRAVLKKPIMILIAMIVIGTFFYHFIEGWAYLDALYFTAVTATTVGYGDFHPETPIGKIFTIIFSFVVIALVLYFFTLFSKYIFSKSLHQQLVEDGRIRHNTGVRHVRKKTGVKQVSKSNGNTQGVPHKAKLVKGKTVSNKSEASKPKTSNTKSR